jgi:hypothetical protein
VYDAAQAYEVVVAGQSYQDVAKLAADEGVVEAAAGEIVDEQDRVDAAVARAGLRREIGLDVSGGVRVARRVNALVADDRVVAEIAAQEAALRPPFTVSLPPLIVSRRGVPLRVSLRFVPLISAIAISCKKSGRSSRGVPSARG